MTEPSRSTSRRAIAAATLVVIGVATAGFLLGRTTAPPEHVPVAAAPQPKSVPARPVPAVEPPLGRGDLIAAAALAADAYGGGRPSPHELADLIGRDFELRLPFACPGTPAAEGASLLADYDEDAQALRVRAEPARWAPEEWLPHTSETDGAEAIEGFWIERPWTSEETCPASPTSPTSPPAAAPPNIEGENPLDAQGTTAIRAEPSLGLAQFFTAGSSRIGRRNGQPYRAVERVVPEGLDLTQGLRLRLRGEVAASPAGPPILCRGATETRPQCMISVRLSEVAIENPATAATIATWDVATQSRGVP